MLAQPSFFGSDQALHNPAAADRMFIRLDQQFLGLVHRADNLFNRFCRINILIDYLPDPGPAIRHALPPT